ncbi:MAG: HIT domain-containing protein [Candidatus Pacearchaeota archaeon]
MLTQEQAKEIKNQLLKQLDKFPEEQREELEEQIEEMDAKELEEFLVKNKIVSDNNETNSPFRAIIEGKIPSYKVGENEGAIAVLEINPISKAHLLIIPKQPATNSHIPKEALGLAETMAKKIKIEFNVKKVEIIPSKILGETIINVLPVYNGENLETKREKASESELKEIQHLLIKEIAKEKVKKTRIKKEVSEKKPRKPRKKSEERAALPKAPVRIP